MQILQVTDAKPRPAAPILRQGETCWRIAAADRVAFLIDGESFFAALRAALVGATRQVLMVGWDFHSRVRLRAGERERADELVPWIDHLARRRRGPRFHILGWDYAMLYSLEREFLPLLHFGARTHRRVQFRLDDAHPAAASHHQKVIVIDDRVAFVGGFDVTAHRWDTREHRPGDPRRTTPEGEPYPPFHDVQALVSGEVAAALGDLARERWRVATGRRLRRPAAARGTASPWPGDVEPDVRDARVGIARTQPAYRGRTEVREVESLHLASIAAARHSIYVENQYLTSDRVAAALEERLREPDGPDIVIVGPERCTGWLEESSMGVLRDGVMRRLRDADRGGRLRLLHPYVPGLAEGEIVNVHAKLMIVDDRMARIGSANLSNRSMGLDTECDLALEAEVGTATSRAIARLRADLLGEHLAAEPDEVERALEREGSLARAVDALRRREGRSLRPLEERRPPWASDVASALGVLDPERPLSLEGLLEADGQDATRDAPPRRAAAGLVWLAALALLALAWRFGPLAQWADPEALGALAAPLRRGASGAALGAALFAGLALLMFPVLGLIATSALLFEPWRALAVSLAGTAASAVLGYLLGRRLLRDQVRRIAGRRLEAVSRKLARSGVLATAAIRLVPVAPYDLVNLVAGASHVRLRDFALGTMLAMTPGIAVLTFAADRIARAVRSPDPASWAWALLGVGAAAGVLYGLRRLASGDPGR